VAKDDVKRYNKNAKAGIKAGKFGPNGSLTRVLLVDKTTKGKMSENARKSVSSTKPSVKATAVKGAKNKMKAQGMRVNMTPSTTAADRSRTTRGK